MKKHYYNPFNPYKRASTDLFINRDTELYDAIQHLCYDGSNIQIRGDAGIGKTSFLFHLKNHIKMNFNNCLVLYLELFSALGKGDNELRIYFLNAILSEIWTDIFGKPYSSLLEEIKQPDEKISRENEEGKIITLYKLVRSSSIKSGFEKETTFGAKALLEAGVSTKSSSDFQFDNLLPFEFTNILEEIVLIIQKHGRDKIILLLDEADILTLNKADEIIRKNFDLFSNDHLHYAFSTFVNSSYFSYETGKIQHWDIKINNFENKFIMDELIDKYTMHGNKENKLSIMFNDQAREKIWEYSVGNPKKIQKICYWLWDKAVKSDIKVIDNKITLEILSGYHFK
jgi:hypothetical protein